MVKRLLNEKQGESIYGSDAHQLDYEITQAISPILAKYHEAGYSVIDMEHIAISSIFMECTSLQLGWNSTNKDDQDDLSTL